jgi:O-acetylhomoserine (thiol)-lyase
MNDDWDFETKAIHSGADAATSWGATSFPIFQSAAFEYESGEDLEEVFAGKRFGFLYSRITNPTVVAFERRLQALEGGVGAVATSSGMAAIHTVIGSLTRSGEEIAASSSLFGGTLRLFSDVMTRFGIVVRYFDPLEPAGLAAVLGEKTRLVFVESIGNPRVDVPDIAAIGAVAKRAKLPLVVDGTLVSPYLCHPRDYGAALVVHSTTKYITGNGSSIGGALVDLGTYDWSGHPDPDIRSAAQKVSSQFAFLSVARRLVLQNTGSCQAPFDAYMHLIGLETLALRMERHCSNALALGRLLESHDRAGHVNYPGLKSSRSHAVACRQFGDRYGGLLTVQLGSKQRCFDVIRKLSLAKNLANLGDAKTLVIHPASTIYRDCTEEERQAAGVTGDLLRISVGIESERDIINDFEKALEEA